MEQKQKCVSPMSNEGRNTYVLEHLTDAMLQLLSDKQIEEISIRELCDAAGVGRASFYRNFESKEDILRSYINKLFEEWTAGYNQNGDRPLNELIQVMFSHFEKYMDFYKLLNRQKLIYLLKDVIIGFCGPKPEYEKGEAYVRAFVAYTLYGWIEVWFQRGMKESSEEMANLFKMLGL